MVDGVAGVELLGLILDPAADATPLPSDVWRPRPGPALGRLLRQSVDQATSSGFGLARAMWGAATHPTAPLGPMREAVRAVTVASRMARPMVVSSLNGPIGSNRRWAGASVAVEDVKKVRSTFGGAFNDVVLAAVTLWISRPPGEQGGADRSPHPDPRSSVGPRPG